MEVIINDLIDLKPFLKVRKRKKEIILKFEDVVFNCALPSKNKFNYFQDYNISNYTISIIAKRITFNYYAECDNIYANEVVSEDSLICKILNVIGRAKGKCISTNIFVGIYVETNTLIVNKIVCHSVKALLLTIDNRDYSYLVASSVNNIGV